MISFIEWVKIQEHKKNMHEPKQKKLSDRDELKVKGKLSLKVGSAKERIPTGRGAKACTISKHGGYDRNKFKKFEC